MPFTSAKDLNNFTAESKTRIVAVIGDSGVGKSAVRNHLVVGGSFHSIINQGHIKRQLRAILKQGKDKQKPPVRRDHSKSTRAGKDHHSNTVDDEMVAAFVSKLQGESGIAFTRYFLLPRAGEGRRHTSANHTRPSSLFALCTRAVLALDQATLQEQFLSLGVPCDQCTTPDAAQPWTITRARSMLPSAAIGAKTAARIHMIYVESVSTLEFIPPHGDSIARDEGRAPPRKPIVPTFRNSHSNISSGRQRSPTMRKISWLLQDVCIDQPLSESSIIKPKRPLPISHPPRRSAHRLSDPLLAVDGAVVVVDAIEGITPYTEELLIRVVHTRTKPILFLNKMDELLCSSNVNYEKTYLKLKGVIDDANDVLQRACCALRHEPLEEAPSTTSPKWSTRGSSDVEESPGGGTVEKRCFLQPSWSKDARVALQTFAQLCLFSPVLGNVIFGSALQGWGFTLDSIARTYQERGFQHLTKEDGGYTFIDRLWGQHYFNPSKGTWSTGTPTKREKKKNPTMMRGFSMFALTPIVKLYQAVFHEFCAPNATIGSTCAREWECCIGDGEERGVLRGRDTFGNIIRPTDAKRISAGRRTLEKMLKKIGVVLPGEAEDTQQRIARACAGDVSARHETFKAAMAEWMNLPRGIARVLLLSIPPPLACGLYRSPLLLLSQPTIDPFVGVRRAVMYVYDTMESEQRNDTYDADFVAHKGNENRNYALARVYCGGDILCNLENIALTVVASGPLSSSPSDASPRVPIDASLYPPAPPTAHEDAQTHTSSTPSTRPSTNHSHGKVPELVISAASTSMMGKKRTRKPFRRTRSLRDKKFGKSTIRKRKSDNRLSHPCDEDVSAKDHTHSHTPCTTTSLSSPHDNNNNANNNATATTAGEGEGVEHQHVLDGPTHGVIVAPPFSFRPTKVVRVCGGVVDDNESPTSEAGLVAFYGLDWRMTSCLRGATLVSVGTSGRCHPKGKGAVGKANKTTGKANKTTGKAMKSMGDHYDWTDDNLCDWDGNDACEWLEHNPSEWLHRVVAHQRLIIEDGCCSGDVERTRDTNDEAIIEDDVMMAARADGKDDGDSSMEMEHEETSESSAHHHQRPIKASDMASRRSSSKDVDVDVEEEVEEKSPHEDDARPSEGFIQSVHALLYETNEGSP